MEIFLHNSPLVAGNYFLGHYAWPTERKLVGALLQCQPDPAQALEITLEIAGSLTARKFSVPASPASEVSLSIPLDVTLPAGSEVRWRVTAPASPGGGLASITLSVAAVGAAPLDELTLVWVHGSRVPVYTYDATSCLFAPTVYQPASPFVLTQAASIEVAMNGEAVLRVGVDYAEAKRFRQQFTSVERLEFCRNGASLMNLNADGIEVNLLEGSVNEATTGFRFRPGGITGASLDEAGLKSLQFREPLSP